jgi:hypothetical protein
MALLVAALVGVGFVRLSTTDEEPKIGIDRNNTQERAAHAPEDGLRVPERGQATRQSVDGSSDSNP